MTSDPVAGVTRAAAIVEVALLAVLAATSVLAGQAVVAAQLVGFAALGTLVLAVHSQPRAQLPVFGLVTVVCANALGFAFDLFERLAVYDELAHGFTLCAIAFAIAKALPQPFKDEPRVSGALTTGTALALGTMWELLEWSVTLVFPPFTMDVDDTLSDLLYGLIGAAVGAWAALTRRSHRSASRAHESRSR